MDDLDGEGSAFDVEDGAVVQELRDGLGFESGGHDDENEVGADGLLDFAEEGDGQIGVEAALVEFVEDDCADAFEEWIIDELAGEDAFGHDAQAGIGGHAALEANLVADLLAERPAVFVGDALGGGAGGDAAGLEHDEIGMIGGEKIGLEDGGRDAGGFASARLGDEDEGAGLSDALGDLREVDVDGEGDQWGVFDFWWRGGGG